MSPTKTSPKLIEPFTSKITDLFVPRNIEEALDNPNWKLAFLNEFNALKKNET
jgi:hypothetical protein